MLRIFRRAMSVLQRAHREGDRSAIIAALPLRLRSLRLAKRLVGSWGGGDGADRFGCCRYDDPAADPLATARRPAGAAPHAGDGGNPVVTAATPPATPETPPVSPSTPPPAPEPPLDPDAAERSFQEGFARQSAGDLDGAIVSYTNAIRLNPQDSRAYFNRARSYFYKGAGFYDQIIADANKAIELGPPNLADAYSLRGTGWAGKGNLDKAIADHTRAIKLNPNHALVYKNRADGKLRQGDLEGALADCNKSIALDPSSPLPYYNRGFVYANRGNLKLAIADWEKAIQMQPAYRAELEPLIQKLGGKSK